MKSFRSELTKCLLAILSTVGIVSCKRGEIYFPATVMYGCPNIDLKVSGKVTDMQSTPIKGILVKTPYQSDSILTQSDGTFNISINTAMTDSARLEFCDIDGEGNGGQFADKAVSVGLEQSEPGDGKWYKGTYEANDVIVKMEKKN